MPALRDSVHAQRTTASVKLSAHVQQESVHVQRRNVSVTQQKSAHVRKESVHAQKMKIANVTLERTVSVLRDAANVKHTNSMVYV